MNLESMISEVIPTMLWAWIFVGLFILGVQLLIKKYIVGGTIWQRKPQAPIDQEQLHQE